MLTTLSQFFNEHIAADGIVDEIKDLPNQAKVRCSRCGMKGPSPAFKAIHKGRKIKYQCYDHSR